jgi:hypothetical protein
VHHGFSELMRPRPDPRVLGWVGAQPIALMAITAITVMEQGRRMRSGRLNLAC